MNNPFDLTGKRILVTGASSGIGRSVAIECSKMGAEMILLGRNEDRLQETLELLSKQVNHQYFSMDLSGDADFEVLRETLSNCNLDGLVNCAGIIDRKPLNFIKKDRFHNLMDINVLSTLDFVKFLKRNKFLKSESSIVFISSVAKDYAALGNIMYMSSKGAVNSMSKGLALELSKDKIRVNCIEPGLIVSNLTKGISENELADNINLYPLGRFGKSEEVAYGCIYLLSDASKWITGTSLRIDGGLTLK